MNIMYVTGSIVTYNNIRTIEHCIDTVLQYTKDLDFKLYVIDNGSTDGTLDVLRHFEKISDRVELIVSSHNDGFGSGHNKVLSKLNSKYHAVINPDISMTENVIANLCEYLEAHDEVLQITPKVLNEDGSEQHLPKYTPTIRYCFVSKFPPFRYLRRRYTREEEGLSEATSVEFCTGCFFVIRSETFKALGGFDERYFMYCEDADLSKRIRKQGTIIFYPKTVVTHLWQRDNTRSLRGTLRFMSSYGKFVKRWGLVW